MKARSRNLLYDTGDPKPGFGDSLEKVGWGERWEGRFKVYSHVYAYG